uniref:SREBP regulating gene protein n=1 Tax=Cucumis sativus TaxID=3659 RepID=A0A0A0KXE1_CUCSA
MAHDECKGSFELIVYFLFTLCSGCNLVLQCCNSYEYCVSCCQNPSRTKREQILKIKNAKPATAGRRNYSVIARIHSNGFSSEVERTRRMIICSINSSEVTHELREVLFRQSPQSDWDHRLAEAELRRTTLVAR